MSYSPLPQLETARPRLRRPDDRDTEAAIAYLGSDRSRLVGGPTDRGTAWRAHAGMVGHWTLRGFGMVTVTLKTDGAIIGQVGCYFPCDWPERELGWHIWSPVHEGCGLAFEAALAVRDHAFGRLGWPTAVSYIDPANARSIALAVRLGARLDSAALAPEPGGALVFRHSRPEGF